MPKIVYSERYNFGFWGLERLHPFDAKKYRRAWHLIRSELSSEQIEDVLIDTDREATAAELKLVHSSTYLRKLQKSKTVAQAVEIPLIAMLPGFLSDRQVLRPMRWAVRGTMLAAEAAMEHEFAVNLGGGFHHAKPESGEGFSVYSDIAIAVEHLRQKGLLGQEESVVYVDTDAHQGNGVCHAFLDDARTVIFDIYNSMLYPNDPVATDRIDCAIKIGNGCGDDEYGELLERTLPKFLDSEAMPIGLVVYNAGTDVFTGDPLGNMNLSAEAILRRDLFVVGEFRRRHIPTVMVLSGGYTRESYRLVATSVLALIRQNLSSRPLK